MRVDLSETQWWSVTDGELMGPDGTKYVRRSTKAKRRACDDLLAAGSPLVLYYYGGGQLEWTDGDDADSEWSEARSSLTTTEPIRGGMLVWTAGVWQANDDRSIVLLTAHC